MPELPEVETVRRGLERWVVGRRVTGVEIGRDRTVRRTSPAAVVNGLTGATFTAVGRRGKYLLLALDTGDEVMIHLRMSGRLLVSPAGEVRPDHTHVVARLDDGNELRFVDPRTFGEVVVFDPEHVEVEVPELAALGPDPISDGIDVSWWEEVLGSRHRRVKPLLLDQRVVAGIGNIYADEILHRARIRPDRFSDEIGPARVRGLHSAVVEVLAAAIDAGGSTLADAQYVGARGEAGSYQERHVVYGRTGQRCSTCGIGWIRRTVSAQRSTHFCPRCQR